MNAKGLFEVRWYSPENAKLNIVNQSREIICHTLSIFDLFANGVFIFLFCVLILWNSSYTNNIDYLDSWRCCTLNLYNNESLTYLHCTDPKKEKLKGVCLKCHSSIFSVKHLKVMSYLQTKLGCSFRKIQIRENCASILEGTIRYHFILHYYQDRPEKDGSFWAAIFFHRHPALADTGQELWRQSLGSMCHISPRCYHSVDDCGLASFQCMQERTPFLASDLKSERKIICLIARADKRYLFLHETCYIWKIVFYNRGS